MRSIYGAQLPRKRIKYSLVSVSYPVSMVSMSPLAFRREKAVKRLGQSAPSVPPPVTLESRPRSVAPVRAGPIGTSCAGPSAAELRHAGHLWTLGGRRSSPKEQVGSSSQISASACKGALQNWSRDSDCGASFFESDSDLSASYLFTSSRTRNLLHHDRVVICCLVV